MDHQVHMVDPQRLTYHQGHRVDLQRLTCHHVHREGGSTTPYLPSGVQEGWNHNAFLPVRCTGWIHNTLLPVRCTGWIYNVLLLIRCTGWIHNSLLPIRCGSTTSYLTLYAQGVSTPSCLAPLYSKINHSELQA